MAKIDVKVNDQVDASGASFVQQSTAVADTSLGDTIGVLGDTAAAAITRNRERAAEAGSKSLLEEFTGHRRLQAISEEQDALLDQEEEINAKIGKQVTSNDPAAALSEQQLASIQKTKDQLDVKKAGVEQGLLTLDEYRLQAETLFYQTVAMTPGLKDEVAAVMGDFLGIDPRGQLAKVTMEERKAALKAGRDEMKVIKSGMQKDGAWDLSLTESENLARFGPRWLEEQRALAELDKDGKQLAVDSAATDKAMEGKAEEIRRKLITAEPAVLKRMSQFEGLNAFNLSAADLRSMDKDTLGAWAAHITAEEQTVISRINALESGTRGKLNGELHKENIASRATLLREIVSGKLSDDALQAKLNRLDLENKLQVEDVKNGILLTYPEATRLAALTDIMSGELLAINLSQSKTIIDILNGRVPDLTTLSAEEANDKRNTQAWTLNQMSLNADKVKDWSSSLMRQSGILASNISKHQPDELDTQTRQQLNKLTADKGWADRLEAEDPRTFRIVQQNTQRHQEVMTNNLSTKYKGIIEKSGLDLDGNDQFMLQKEDGKWSVVPTTKAVESALPPLTSKNVVGGGKPSESAIRLREKNIQEGLDKMFLGMNGNRGMMNNLIQSRANLQGISESAAARSVAVAIGLSASDVTRAEDLPALPAQSGPTAEEEQRANDDFQPVTDGERESPLNAVEKIEDGTYRINGQLFEVKDGAIVNQPDA